MQVWGELQAARDVLVLAPGAADDLWPLPGLPTAGTICDGLPTSASAVADDGHSAAEEGVGCPAKATRSQRLGFCEIAGVEPRGEQDFGRDSAVGFDRCWSCFRSTADGHGWGAGAARRFQRSYEGRQASSGEPQTKASDQEEGALQVLASWHVHAASS